MFGCLYYYRVKDCESQLLYGLAFGEGFELSWQGRWYCGYLIEVVCVFIAATTCCARNHIPLQT
jgi:hypothetical protein